MGVIAVIAIVVIIIISVSVSSDDGKVVSKVGAVDGASSCSASMVASESVLRRTDRCM